MYLQEVGRLSLLSREQEREVAERAASGDVEAQRALVLGNVRLVIAFARRYYGRGLGLEDLIQEGNLGLLRATQDFDPRREARFATYAAWWIRQAITAAIADRGRTVRLPEHIRAAVRRLRAAEDTLRQQLGREPSRAEIGASMDITAESVGALRAAVDEPVSLDTVGEQQEALLHEIVPDVNAADPADIVCREMCDQALANVLARLNPRLQTVLRLRHGLDDRGPLTLEAIGAILGVGRRRTHQLEHKAYRSLRAPANVRRLDGLL